MVQQDTRREAVGSGLQGTVMRKEFARFITEYAGKNDDIILIVGDIGFGIFDDFLERFPDRFFNFGICEQSMIGAASGMALEGLKPYIYTITPFLIERPFEQVKLDVGQQNTNVKLIGYADYPDQGPTHAELDGKYLMEVFKNIVSYFPNDSAQTRLFLEKSYYAGGPTFMSLKREKNR